MTPTFPRDVDVPPKETSPEISTTKTTIANSYSVQMRASVGTASALDLREYRDHGRRKIRKNGMQIFFSPRASPQSPVTRSGYARNGFHRGEKERERER